MKKGTIITLAVVTILAVAAGAAWYFIQAERLTGGEEERLIGGEEEGMRGRKVKENQTNAFGVYEAMQEANPMLVGLWSEDKNPLHYKFYLDDPCDEEGYFWGKEWDEKDGVYEEDQSYHGNGWFKWSKTKETITEIYVSEQGNMVVPIEYLIEQLNDTAFVYNEFEVAKTIFNKSKKVPYRTFRYHKL